MAMKRSGALFNTENLYTACISIQFNLICLLVLQLNSMLILPILYIIVAFSAACADHAPACYPKDTPCPYKECLRLSIHYVNASDQAKHNVKSFNEDIVIKLGGFAGFLSMKAKRHFSQTLVHDQTTDCIFDSKELMRKTSLSNMHISLSDADNKTERCDIDLVPNQIKGTHSYTIEVTQGVSHLSCSAGS